MKYFYIIVASISLGLGILGIFLPILPTTPFLLLSASLYFKSSPRLYQWLMNHKTLGPYIRNYREYKAMTRTAKIGTLTLMWAVMLFSVFFVAKALWLQILLIAIGIGVSVHILRFKTLTKEQLKAQDEIARGKAAGAGEEYPGETTASGNPEPNTREITGECSGRNQPERGAGS